MSQACIILMLQTQFSETLDTLLKHADINSPIFVR